MYNMVVQELLDTIKSRYLYLYQTGIPEAYKILYMSLFPSIQVETMAKMATHAVQGLVAKMKDTAERMANFASVLP